MCPRHTAPCPSFHAFPLLWNLAAVLQRYRQLDVSLGMVLFTYHTLTEEIPSILWGRAAWEMTVGGWRVPKRRVFSWNKIIQIIPEDGVTMTAYQEHTCPWCYLLHHFVGLAYHPLVGETRWALWLLVTPIILAIWNARWRPSIWWKLSWPIWSASKPLCLYLQVGPNATFGIHWNVNKNQKNHEFPSVTYL